MRWLKRDMWKVGIALAGLLLLLVLMVWVPASAAAYEGTSGLATPVTGTMQAAPTKDATVTALNREKLALDVTKESSDIFWSWTAMGTIVIGVAGVAITIYQFLRNRRDTQDKELRDRAEERFKTAVTALGDKNEGTQVGGAILLRSFLNKDDKKIYGRYYAQIFDLAVAYLRLSNPSGAPEDPDGLLPPPEDPNAPVPLTPLRQALIFVFKEAFPLARDRWGLRMGVVVEAQSLDASRIRLDGTFLVSANLGHIWMAEAFLRKADLSDAKLIRANLDGAFLNDADLSGAFLIDAYLRGAYLRGANLQYVHLHGTELSRADFRAANLSHADLSMGTLRQANLSKADLREANVEEAISLENTDLRGVKGLIKEQLAACKARGAIINEGPATDSSQPTVPPAPTQSSDAQTPSAPPAQVNTPPPNTDGSHC